MTQNHGRSFDRPCVVLMGEFSAGKSTVINFLIGRDILPTKVTATELPPVWLSHGDSKAAWVDDAGIAHGFDIDDFAAVPAGARQLRISARAEILRHCDIVDTPGISDPNLADDCWGAAVLKADMVLWCTTATQAWRESERGMWTSLPAHLRKHSILVVTRSDKLVIEADRDKVARRLQRETAGLFADTTFIAATDAMRARAGLGDEACNTLWLQSGGAALLRRLHGGLEAILQARAVEVPEGQVPVMLPAVDSDMTADLEVASADGAGAQGSAVIPFASAIQPRRVGRVRIREVERPLPGDPVNVLSDLHRNWLSLAGDLEAADFGPSSAPFLDDWMEDASDHSAAYPQDDERPGPLDDRDPLPSVQPGPGVRPDAYSGPMLADTKAGADLAVTPQADRPCAEDVAVFASACEDRDLLVTATEPKADPGIDRSAALDAVDGADESDEAAQHLPNAVLAWRAIVSQHGEPTSIAAISAMIEQLLTKLFADVSTVTRSRHDLDRLSRRSLPIPEMGALDLGVKENEVS